MIDSFTVMTKGGLVLFNYATLPITTGTPITATPINALIRNVILEQRSTDHHKIYQYEKYTLKYVLDNEYDLLFIVTYQTMFPLAYVEELLHVVKSDFLKKFKNVLSPSTSSSNGNGGGAGSQAANALISHQKQFSDYSDSFKQRLREVEEQDRRNRSLKKQGMFQKAPVSERKRSEKQIKKEKLKREQQNQQQKYQNNNNNSSSSEDDDEDDSDNDNVADESENDDQNTENVHPTPTKTTPEKSHGENNSPSSFNNNNNMSPMFRRSSSRREMKTFTKKDSANNLSSSSSPSPNTNSGKKATIWLDEQKYTKSAAAALNANKKLTSSSSSTSNSALDEQVKSFMSRYMPDKNARTVIDDDSDVFFGDQAKNGGQKSSLTSSKKLEEEEDDESANGKKSSGLFGSFISSLTNGKTIEKSELEPVMQQFKEALVAKNVAAEIADEICKSVASDLTGKKIGAFTRLKSTVTQSLEETMTRILTPKRNIDILRDIMTAREQNRPYVITFCGVNGVGKSTSLSKICFWLLQNNLKCLIAACDTFRSGAVEQLKVHAKCLNVPVYESGYGKDISTVAQNAISEARRKNYDVVLVDTAGRMQDNEPLMKSLTKLIDVNNPDLVLFVGEALVGNDGIDQLVKFNDALKNITMVGGLTSGRRDLIDGIVLTKFDTIDDKVGAAISMVHKTGHPIVFIGVGQTYTDLKKLSIKSVVRALLN